MEMPLNFRERVDIATRIVQNNYSNAAILTVEAFPEGGRPAKATELEKLKIIFAGPSIPGSGFSTIEITSCGWSEFKEPIVHHGPWGGSEIIKWPVKLDLAEAEERKDLAGFSGPSDKLNFGKPLCYPPIPHPLYNFIMIEKGMVIFVDAETGEVHTQKM